jgi:hypothetical protein
MNKYSIVKKTDWDDFIAATDPETLSFWKRESNRFPNHVFVCLSEATWKLAKATGKFLTLPTPWAPVSRLPVNVKNLLGTIASDALTVGQAIEDLIGKDIFRD